MTNAKIREYENAHIVLWLIKDFCWCTGLHVLGMAMILPTLAVAIDITRRSRRNLGDLWTNVAVCCWIAANATWMTGEFYFNDGFRPYAEVFFVMGLGALALYYGVIRVIDKRAAARLGSVAPAPLDF